MLGEGRACLASGRRPVRPGSCGPEGGRSGGRRERRTLTSKVLRFPPRGAGLNQVSIQGCKVKGAGKRERMPGNWLGVSGEGHLGEDLLVN